MISTRLKVNHENKQPPPIIPSEYKVSAMKFAGAYAIFWIIFYGFWFSNILSLERYPVSEFQIVAWIICWFSSWHHFRCYMGANNMAAYNVDFNDGVNIAVMTRMGICEVYSNDQKHLGKIDFLRTIFG